MFTAMQRTVLLVWLGLLLVSLAVPVAAAVSLATAKVNIDNFKFGPGTLTVTKGSEVTWTNEDDIPHSIVFGALGVKSKTLDTDNAFTYHFDKSGVFDYVCGLHPFMHGKVVVK